MSFSPVYRHSYFCSAPQPANEDPLLGLSTRSNHNFLSCAWKYSGKIDSILLQARVKLNSGSSLDRFVHMIADDDENPFPMPKLHQDLLS